LQRAAKKGYSEGQWRVAGLKFNYGETEDVIQSYAFKVHLKGSVQGTYWYGKSFSDGKKKIKFLTISAEQNHPQSLISLGLALITIDSINFMRKTSFEVFFV
jgi:TPR repeat protein